MFRENRMRRYYLRGIAALTAGLTLSPCLAESSESPKPNIILIIGDDISIDDFGFYGHPHIRTPNIDKLAANGIHFTNAYLTASQCSPTRCSVISGRYPHNSGGPELHQPLPAGQPMFPLELKKANYHTVAAGKWHLGNYAKNAFDKIVDSGPGGEERWVECLQKRPKDKPFFMWFASYDAHRGWQEDKLAEKHKKADAIVPPYMADMDGTREDLARYYDEIQRLDRYVGLVVKELKQQEVLDNTIIIFMTDNGRPFPRCKTWLYDGGIKTPVIMHWPKGITKTGTTSQSLVSVIDIAPTILGLAGLDVPEAIQGVSFAPILKDPEQRIREYAFAEHNWHDMEAHERMVHWNEWVYIRNARPQFAGWAHAHYPELSYKDLFALRKDHKLTPAQADVLLAPRPAEMLFNVKDDYHQLNNLANDPEHKEILAHMRTVLDKWQEATGDSAPVNLTKDIIDRKTYKWTCLPSKSKVPRGTTPGSERNATTINDPGPR